MREAPIRSPAGEGADPAAADARAGYVLIEAVAALVIITLLLRFVFPTVAPGTTPSRFLALVSASVSLLREARTAAVMTDRPVAARFDAGRRRLWTGAETVPIPPDVAFSLVAGGNCPARDGTGEIVFRPDGSNCGGVLRFSRGTRTMRARVNWVDGHVDIVEGG